MNVELIITTPCSGTEEKQIFSQTFSMDVMELVTKLRANSIDYDHLLKFLTNKELNNSFYNLLNKRVIPLELKIKETDTTCFPLSTHMSLSPCLKQDAIILIRNKKIGIWSMDFFNSKRASCKDIVTPFNVQGILTGEKEVFFIEDRADLNLFLVQYHYLSKQDEVKLINLFERNLGKLKYSRIEEEKEAYEERFTVENYSCIDDEDDLPF